MKKIYVFSDKTILRNEINIHPGKVKGSVKSGGESTSK